MLFLTFSALVANPEELPETVANTARGLLNPDHNNRCARVNSKTSNQSRSRMASTMQLMTHIFCSKGGTGEKGIFISNNTTFLYSECSLVKKD